VLRVSERTDRIHHIAEVLYLWRMLVGSAAGDAQAKPWAFDAGRRAVQEHCDRVGIDAVVEMLAQPGSYRVRRRVRGEPIVSIVIPTRGSSARVQGVPRVHVLHAVTSVLERSTYANYELVVVADRETPDAVIVELERLCGDRLRVVWFDGAFNFSAKVNAGVASSAGDVVVLLNDDIEVLTPDWIETMVALAQEPDCGLVGCKLLFADGTLQHAGHVYRGGNMTHAYLGYPGDEPGMANLLQLERECSGVTAACAAVRREVWEQVGGFCEQLPGNFNDVDFSLKIRHRGLRVVWTPHAILYHFESLTRIDDVKASEVGFIDRRWARVLLRDPYFNPNLDQLRADWVVFRPPETWVS
jgi:GT2 family glycosyltransferase